MQNLWGHFLLFCAKIWPSHHVDANQEYDGTKLYFEMTLGTFRSEVQDDYVDEFPYWTCALGLEVNIFRSARAQYGKLVLVVGLVLRSKGP